MAGYEPVNSEFIPTHSFSDGGFTQEAKDKYQAAQAAGQYQGGIGQEGLSNLGDKLSQLGGFAVGGVPADQQGTGGQQGPVWGGTYPPPVEHNCPYCGRCRHCGGGGGYVPNYPQPLQPYRGPNFQPTVTSGDPAAQIGRHIKYNL